jgi:hypothetical protein
MYFEQILPYLSDRALVIFDDISWSVGMCSAWKKIVGTEAVRIAVYLKAIGICVIDKSIKEKRVYKCTVTP